MWVGVWKIRRGALRTTKFRKGVVLYGQDLIEGLEWLSV